jgi:hypothetical protein
MKPGFSGGEWSKVGGKLNTATDSSHLRMKEGAQVTGAAMQRRVISSVSFEQGVLR